MSYIQISSLVQAPQDKVFAAISQPEQLGRAWASEVDVQVLSQEDQYTKGSEVIFRMSRFGFTQPLTLTVEEWKPPALLTLKQTQGPFKYWLQKIKLEEHSESATLVTMSINYTLPLGLLGNLADDLFIRSDLNRLLQKHIDSLDLT